MATAGTTIALDAGEYALVIGQDGERMSVRTEGPEPPVDENGELPVPAALVVALAERLLSDPDFHDEMLEWLEAHADDETDEDEGGENGAG
jgi:hypothetical protein